MSDPNNWFTEPPVKEGYTFGFYPVRWTPYHKKHRKQSKKKGRWQRMTEYGGWENCDPPGKIIDNPRDLSEALSKIIELEELVSNLRSVVCELEAAAEDEYERRLKELT